MSENEPLITRLNIPDIAFFVAVTLYCLYLYSLTITYPEGSALFPLITLYTVFGLCLVGVIIAIVVTRSNWMTVVRSDDFDLRSELRTVYEPSTLGRVVFYLAFVFGYVVLVPLVGFFTATLVVSFAHIYYNKRGLIVSVGGSIAMTLGMYAIFIYILERTLLLRGDVIFETLF